MGCRWPRAFLGGVGDWFAEVFVCGCCCSDPSSRDTAPPPLGPNAAIFSQPESSSSSDADEALSFVEIDVLRPDLNAKRHYPSNSIRTATYTFLSSIPLSLLYQFRKVSNIYFLLVMIISLVPGASPINPFSSVAPLCIVLGAGVVKDLWEDWRRRRADTVANNQEVSVLRDGTFTTVKSRSVQPGDVMLFRLGEEVKADSLIVNTSLADGLTYIETANLDGETNAKTRRAKLQTVELLGTVEDIMELALGKSAVPANRNAAASAVAVARLQMQVDSCSSPSTTLQRSHELVDVKNKVPTPSMRRGDDSTTMCPVPTSPTAAPPRPHQQACMTSVPPPSAGAGDAIFHGRFRTLDARMELEGALPVPDVILGMSRQYEAQHSRSVSGVPDTLQAGKVAPGFGATGRGNAPGDPGCGCGGSAGIGTDSSTAFEHPQSHGGLPRPSGTAADARSPGKSGVVVLGSPPSPDLATWFGQLRLPTGELVPLGVEQFLPRGCIIRNTDWVLGIVVYTGRHTKMLLNLRPKPSKTTVMLRRLHRLNIFLFIVNQIAILVLCGLAISFKHRMLRKEPGVKSGYSAWYIQWSLERDSDAQLFGWRYLTNFVLLSSLIPISLYVTLEFNKAVQMLLIGADKRMAVFDEFKGELLYTRPKTSELNCQLGLVQYIFTDKTGTLTENLMTYVGGYVGGIMHDERARPGDLGCRLLRSFGGSRSWFPAEGVDGGSGSDRPPVGACPQVDVVDVAPTPTGRFVRAANVRGVSAGTASCRGTPPSMVTIDGQQLDESRLEEDKVFRYLRCLALCHCVVCFDVPTSGDTTDAHPSPGKDRRKRQERRRHRAQPKAKTNTHRGTGGRWSPSRTAATPPLSPDAANVVHHRSGSSARPTIFVANAVPAAPADRTTVPVPDGDGGGRGLGQPADSAHKVVECPRAREEVEVHPRFTPVLSVDYSEPPRNTPLGRGAGGSRVDMTLPVVLDRFPVSPPEDHPRRTRTMSLSRTLHGRTGSASWYTHRYNANVLHQRSLTMGTLGETANPLDSYIDRSKIYEGQSLDEIAFVSAARENGFSLLRRTAKQICVLVLGQVMCYNIIAELEFTPERKLMSILLQRNPAGDSIESATQVLGTAHYHRQDGGGGTLESPSNKLPEGGQPVKDPSSPRQPHLQAEMQPAGPETQRWEAETARTSPLARNTTFALMGGSGGPHRRPSPPPMAVPSMAAPGPSFLLLVKGADSSMFDIINPANRCNAEIKIACQHHITAMASNGLRTLMLGQRYLTEKEVREWLPIYQRAQCVVDQRNERLHEAYALLEKDIDLIGATAVEDKLQDGVPETLKFLTEASIVVWMLTGDKRETAVTIAHTSGLVDPEYPEEVCHLDISDLMMEAAHRRPAAAGDGLRPKEPTTYMVDECTGEPYPGAERDLTAEMARAADAQLAAVEARCASWEALTKGDASLPARAVVLVVDGKTLDFLFDSNAYAGRFFALGVRCRSAVCCRMTPLHKAQIVSMFQKNMKAVALAVGDGANDVTMLQESRIGVGIMGLEGSQAELASDFAIPKFRFLKRLLMVHGRFSIYREANCILFSMYKNVAITGVQFGYSLYCGFSGQTFVDSWLLAMLATFFCSLQPLAIGIFDKDVEDELAEAVPPLYAPLSREETYFSIGDIAKWLSDGLIEGLTFFILLMNTTALNEDLYAFRMGGIEDYGQTFFTMMVLVVNLRAGTMVSYYMILLVITILIELAALPIFEIVYSALPELAGSNWSVYTAQAMYRSGKLYLLLFFAVGVMIVYSLATYLYVEMFVPRRSAKLAMEAARVSPYRDAHRAMKRKLMEEYHSALGRSVGAGRRGGYPRGRIHNSQP